MHHSQLSVGYYIMDLEGSTRSPKTAKNGQRYWNDSGIKLAPIQDSQIKKRRLKDVKPKLNDFGK